MTWLWVLLGILGAGVLLFFLAGILHQYALEAFDFSLFTVPHLVLMIGTVVMLFASFGTLPAPVGPIGLLAGAVSLSPPPDSALPLILLVLAVFTASIVLVRYVMNTNLIVGGTAFLLIAVAAITTIVVIILLFAKRQIDLAEEQRKEEEQKKKEKEEEEERKRKEAERYPHRRSA